MTFFTHNHILIFDTYKCLIMSSNGLIYTSCPVLRERRAQRHDNRPTSTEFALSYGADGSGVDKVQENLSVEERSGN